MNRRSVLAAGLGAPLLLAGCQASYPLRYRFKIVCRVNGELREGSSVIHTRTADLRGSCCGRSFVGKYKGEAPAVDLGNGRWLFGLLRRVFYESDGAGMEEFYSTDMPNRVLGRRFPEALAAADQNLDNVPALLRLVRTVEGEVDLRPEDYPTFVTFRDLNNPDTVEIVRPEQMRDRLGADLVRCSIQLTGERVTRRLYNVLPWLKDWPPPERSKIAISLIDDTRVDDPRSMITHEWLAKGV